MCLVLLGAAELVLGRAAAEDVGVVVRGGAVEAGVPLARHVYVAGAVLRPQDGCNQVSTYSRYVSRT